MPGNDVDLKRLDEDVSYVSTDYAIKVKLKDVEFLPQTIQSIVIREWVFDFLLTVDIILIDNGLFTEAFPLEDNDVFTIEVAKNKDVEPTIVLEFKIQDHEIENTDAEKARSTAIRMTGILNTNGMLYPIKNRSFSQTESTSVIRSIMDEVGLNSNINITTNDNMTWLQINQSNMDFVKHVLKRSYKEDDAIFGYTDRTGEFFMTSLNKELGKNDSLKTKYDPRRTLITKEEDKGRTKDESQEATNKDLIYFNNFKIINVSGLQNKITNYGLSYSVYDLGQQIDEVIDSDNHELTDYSYKEKDSVGEIVRQRVYNYKFDEDNLHDNYYNALEQNEYLIQNFFSQCVLLYVRPVDNVKLFDKINLILPSLVNNEDINEVYSGDYLVGGITHALSKNGLYKMILILFRNGINSPSEMKSSEVRLNR